MPPKSCVSFSFSVKGWVKVIMNCLSSFFRLTILKKKNNQRVSEFLLVEVGKAAVVPKSDGLCSILPCLASSRSVFSQSPESWLV